MKASLLVSLVMLVPTALMFSGSAIWFCREKTVWSFLQLVGAGCLAIVVICHLFEAVQLFPSMHWGLENSVGHYLDFWSCVLGRTLFPVGYLFHALTK